MSDRLPLHEMRTIVMKAPPADQAAPLSAQMIKLLAGKRVQLVFQGLLIGHLPRPMHGPQLFTSRILSNRVVIAAESIANGRPSEI